jgi:hypothetical protein
MLFNAFLPPLLLLLLLLLLDSRTAAAGEAAAGEAAAGEAANAAACGVEPSLAAAARVLDLVDRLAEDQAQGMDEAAFLETLEHAIRGGGGGSSVAPLSRDIFGLSPSEKRAVRAVDFSPVVFHHTQHCDFSALADEATAARVKALRSRLRESHLATETALLELDQAQEAQELGWATWTKIGVYTAGIALAIPTGGTSLALIPVANAGVGATDVGIKYAQGDYTGAKLAAGSMAVGLLIPGSGVAASAGLDIGGDVAVELALDAGSDDVVNDMVTETVNMVQGQAQSPIVDVGVSEGMKRVGFVGEKARFKAHAVAFNGEAPRFTIGDYREMQRLRTKILARRNRRWCFFTYVQRSRGSTYLRERLHSASRSVSQMKKLNIEEGGLIKIFEQARHFANEKSLTEVYGDKKLAACVGKKAMWTKMKDMALQRKGGKAGLADVVQSLRRRGGEQQ